MDARNRSTGAGQGHVTVTDLAWVKGGNKVFERQVRELLPFSELQPRERNRNSVDKRSSCLLTPRLEETHPVERQPDG